MLALLAVSLWILGIVARRTAWRLALVPAMAAFLIPLLAIPHYLIVALFIGGTWSAYHFGGLVSVLTVIAAVIVAFTGSYPRSIYDFVLGMNRWVLRVAAYASLMTDEYPPLRLDMGGTESRPEPQDLPLAGMTKG
jgi:hypothetical protein